MSITYIPSNQIYRIPFDQYVKDFTFIVDGKEFKVSRFFADLISPAILKLHYIDKTLDSFEINSQEEFQSFDFSDFLSLFTSESTLIDPKYIPYFTFIFATLKNKEEYMKFFPKFPSKIRVNDVLDRIQKIDKFMNNFNSYNDCTNEENDISLFKNEINFAASHFNQLDMNEIKKLDITIIEQIIKNDKLKLKHEDSLMELLLDLYNNDNNVSYLFENINYSNLSDDEFIKFTQLFNLNDINGAIIKAIFERTKNSHIYYPLIKKSLKTSRYESCKEPAIQTFIHHTDEKLNGIFRYLTNITGGNIHDNGTINVTSNNFYDHNWLPKFVLDFNANSYGPNGGLDAMLVFDFKDYEIEISEYQIMTNKKDDHHPRNWVLEVSTDGNKWDIIDKHLNCSTLNGAAVVGTFDVEKNYFAQHCRLRQCGPNWGRDMEIFAFELYGRLKKKGK